jgi:hypothetical protein
MEISTLFAKLFGALLLVKGLFVFIRPNEVPALVKAYVANKALLYTVSFGAIIVGVAVVSAHNVWVGPSATIVTALGWLMVAKGVVALFFPKVFLGIVHTLDNKGWYVSGATLAVIIGSFLTISSFV